MIRRVLLSFLLLSTLLNAKQYDSNIIAIEAKLFPKIALLEYHIKQNPSKELSIIILAKEIDFNIAEDFKTKIESNYPNRIGGKKVTVNISQFNNSNTDQADVVIVLSHKNKELQKIASWANKNKIVSFAYDPSYLDYNLLASIYIGKSTKPYLNRKIIKEYNFIFDSYLLQLSKFKNED